MKRLVFVAVGLVLLKILFSTVIAVAIAHRDAVFPLPQPELVSAMDSAISDDLSQPHRQIRHIILHTQKLGDVGFTLNLPDPLPAQKLPVIFVMGGLGTGAQNIRYINAAGSNAVVGYDWPMPVQFYSSYDLLWHIVPFYHEVMTIPGQVASSLAWLHQQEWADQQKLSLLGYSMGALAAPAVQDISQRNGTDIGWTIIAYGGMPFGALLAANPHVKPAWLRATLAYIIDILLGPLEPDHHLKNISGHFLVLEGRDDSLIPAKARADLREAVPEPKTVITFAGNHMGVGHDKMLLLQEIIAASRKWLSDSGAVNSLP